MATEQPKIQELTLEDVMGDRFGRYSKYIIQRGNGDFSRLCNGNSAA